MIVFITFYRIIVLILIDCTAWAVMLSRTSEICMLYPGKKTKVNLCETSSLELGWVVGLELLESQNLGENCRGHLILGISSHRDSCQVVQLLCEHLQ